MNEDARVPERLPQDSDSPIDQMPNPTSNEVIATAEEKEPHGQTDLESFAALELEYAAMRRFLPAEIDAFIAKTLRQFPI